MTDIKFTIQTTQVKAKVHKLMARLYNVEYQYDTRHLIENERLIRGDNRWNKIFGKFTPYRKDDE